MIFCFWIPSWTLDSHILKFHFRKVSCRSSASPSHLSQNRVFQLKDSCNSSKNTFFLISISFQQAKKEKLSHESIKLNTLITPNKKETFPHKKSHSGFHPGRKKENLHKTHKSLSKRSTKNVPPGDWKSKWKLWQKKRKKY